MFRMKLRYTMSHNQNLNSKDGEKHQPHTWTTRWARRGGCLRRWRSAALSTSRVLSQQLGFGACLYIASSSHLNTLGERRARTDI